MSRATNSERSPLMRVQSRQSDAPAFIVSDVVPGTLRVSVIVFFVVVLQQIAAAFLLPAILYFAEAIVCQNVYGDVTDPVNDKRCKSTEVQSLFSVVVGFDSTFSMAASMIASIPVGIAADRFGRRPFLVLAVFSGVLDFACKAIVFRFPEIFPIRLMWLCSALEVFGGGRSVFFALLYTILADVTKQEHRASVFFYFSAAITLGGLAGAPISYIVMHKLGAWTTLLAGLGTFAFCILCCCCVPETIYIRKIAQNQQAVEEDIADAADKSILRSSRDAVYAGYQQTVTSMAALFKNNKKLAALLIVVPLIEIGGESMDLFTIYIAKRYSMNWESAKLVDTVRIIAKLFLTMVVFPVASQFLLTRHVSGLRKDFLFAKVGIIAAVVGLLGIGLSPTLQASMVALAIFAFISAYDGGMKSIQTQLAGEQNVAAMFTARSVLESAGGLISGPVFAIIYNIGIKKGSFWIGLPFFVGASCYLVIAIVVFAVSFATPAGYEPAPQNEPAEED